MSLNPRVSKALLLALSFAVVNVASAQNRPATTATKPAAAAQAKPATQQSQSPEATFARWDTDNNKVLSLNEFMAGWRDVQTALILRQLHDNFVLVDVNKSGYIEAVEYGNLELIKRAGPSAPPMSTFDLDKDSKLDFKEYVPMVQTMMKPKS